MAFLNFECNHRDSSEPEGTYFLTVSNELPPTENSSQFGHPYIPAQENALVAVYEYANETANFPSECTQFPWQRRRLFTGYQIWLASSLLRLFTPISTAIIVLKLVGISPKTQSIRDSGFISSFLWGRGLSSLSAGLLLGIVWLVLVCQRVEQGACGKNYSSALAIVHTILATASRDTRFSDQEGCFFNLSLLWELSQRRENRGLEQFIGDALFVLHLKICPTFYPEINFWNISTPRGASAERYPFQLHHQLHHFLLVFSSTRSTLDQFYSGTQFFSFSHISESADCHAILDLYYAPPTSSR